MESLIKYKGKKYLVDLACPLDISMPLDISTPQVNCFYAPYFDYSPVVSGSFVGATSKGGALNFMNVHINPHGNGTHTECVGHIAGLEYTINRQLKQFHHFAGLVSIFPQKMENGERIITLSQLRECFDSLDGNLDGILNAFIIRTLPNDDSKMTRNYSGTNPAYLDPDAARFLSEKGIHHLLIDLPSVDREEDEGKLAAHKAFWNYPRAIRENATITELIYVPNEIKDGTYLLNIQICSFELDVSPSKPVLYPCKPV